ncbi:MAG: CerR family C-terminal domain-containing protein [Novosphingobium sp.]|nr:CerR family C-terminal domain-containing protein [Novosphingobium sp.]
MGKPKRASRSDGVATRARILESAGELFGSQGLATVTSKTIAEKAGVDMASINYHFGSRDGLYRAVLVEAHRRFVGLEELVEISRRDVSSADKLGALLDVVIGRLAEGSQWSTTVLAREMLAPSPHMVVLLDEAISPKFGIVLQILSDIAGIPVEAPELACCLISAIAPYAMLLIAGENREAAERILPRLDPRMLAEHLHRFALAGLHAAGQHYRSNPKLARLRQPEGWRTKDAP